VLPVSVAEFSAFADPLPEPTLLLSGDGRILAGNPAFDDLGFEPRHVENRPLAELTIDSEPEVARYLKRCARTRSFVLGALVFRGNDGLAVPCRTDGCLLRWAENDADVRLLLRITAKASATGRFVALNQRIDDLAHEVRQRQRAEADAREEKERLRVILHSIGDGVIVADPRGCVMLMNPVAEALTGWASSEATGRPLDEVFHVVNETTRQRVANPALRALRDGLIVGLANHSVLLTRDGRECAVDDSAAPVRENSGRIVGSVLVFRDVTRRRASETALRESEGRFRQLADVMPQIVWTADSNGQIDYLNRRWTELTGLPQTLSNTAWSELLHPEDAGDARRLWAASLDAGQPFEMPIRLLNRHTGAYRWHLIRTVGVTDEQGRVCRWFGTATDIDEQKRAEESARYLAAASAALASVVDYKSTLQKVANLAVPYFADWSAVDVVTEGQLERLAVSHRDPARVALVRQIMQEYPPDPEATHGALAVLRTGRPELVRDIPDELLERSARDARHLGLIRSLGLKSYVAVPLTNASGAAFGVLTFATAESGRLYGEADLRLAMDLAHRASIAVENTRLYQALKEIDTRKDEFLAILAHELRNPLAPLSNSLQILRMPGVEPSVVARAHEMMTRQVAHLTRLVDDLMDVSRVMQGKIELRREPVDVGTIVSRAVETMQPLVDAQRHRLSVHLTDPVFVHADAVRLTQVVSNLLANAIKYTPPEGCVWVSTEREENTAVVRVRDNGVGVAPHMRYRIFEMFVQGEESGAGAHGGLGIGLTLVKNLVEMHHGTVEARSEGLGHGAEFVVRLPLSTDAVALDVMQHTSHSVPATASGHRVLVVDDNQDAADSLAMLLRLQGHDVRVAHSGEAALNEAEAYSPDAVFLDIGMPGLDGYEVARRLRTRPGAERLVLAALTGWGQHADRRRSMEAGFNHHIVKPPEAQALESVFADLRRRGPAARQRVDDRQT
jgi:PAS domain S-box-containing protein